MWLVLSPFGSFLNPHETINVSKKYFRYLALMSYKIFSLDGNRKSNFLRAEPSASVVPSHSCYHPICGAILSGKERTRTYSQLVPNLSKVDGKPTQAAVLFVPQVWGGDHWLCHGGNAVSRILWGGYSQ